MKKILVILCAIAVLFSVTACDAAKEQGGDGTNSQTRQISERDDTGTVSDIRSEAVPEPTVSLSDPGTDPEPAITKEEDDMFQIQITVGDKTFFATLYDNETARALIGMLPMTLDMSELNGNEKYYYLDQLLPTDSSKPSGIREGDLMLYGNNCLVLFYKSFSTSYSYTPLGHIDDPAGLAAALGGGSVTVMFSQ